METIGRVYVKGQRTEVMRVMGNCSTLQWLIVTPIELKYL